MNRDEGVVDVAGCDRLATITFRDVDSASAYCNVGLASRSTALFAGQHACGKPRTPSDADVRPGPPRTHKHTPAGCPATRRGMPGARPRDRSAAAAPPLGLRRLVVLGSSGMVTLESLRWLSDVGASFVQIARDGRVLAAYGPPGTDRPGLRRAQAAASLSDRGLELSKHLVQNKLSAQVSTLRAFSDRLDVGQASDAVHRQLVALHDIGSVDELRACEAWAAAAYWQAFASLEVRFARRDAEIVPTHWRTFGGRSSPLANGPRLAANPANAVINFLSALLESEASLTARTLGLDPGLGVLHVDQHHRDSLACDLMEPVRPVIEAYAFDLLTSRPFAARDFHERRTGQCRLTAPLTHELAQTIPRWRQAVGSVAEDFATMLETRGDRQAPTPITGRRRSAARPGGARLRTPRSRKTRACSWCGTSVGPRRRTCSQECTDRVLAQLQEQFVAASSERMRRLAQDGEHPARTAAANDRRRATRAARHKEELAWELEHPEPGDRGRFENEILAGLQGVSAGAIARATGLSVGYCAQIKRGMWVPHPRWWAS